MKELDVVIVGAGAAGIGMALELRKIKGLKYVVLERDRIGESFRRWPAQTRFITPSFNSNPFGMADLNSIDSISSPAIFAGAEHLTGPQYAEYLTSVVTAAQLPVHGGCKVLEVESDADKGFHLVTEDGELSASILIWACGEYQFPDLNPFPGGDWCRHYAQIEDWQILDDGSYVVIGGYESGLDSAINLIKLGHKVRLLVRSKTWDLPDVYDPSQILSPYTRDRFREIESNDRLEIIFDVNVVEVTNESNDIFRVHAKDGRHWDVKQAPILGTGFIKGGGAGQIRDLWDWNEEGYIALNELDESIKTPGLFLVGPQVRHDKLFYCFIYKFRQRFVNIATKVALQFDLPIAPAEGSNDGVWGPFGNSECCENCEC